MKIAKWVEFEKEVEIEICADDIRAALSESSDVPENLAEMNRILNSMAQVAKAIPDHLVSQMTLGNRLVVEKFFREQAVRFAVPEEMR